MYGKSQARITVNGAAGTYGSTIKSYSIETSPSIGSATESSLLTGILYRTGTITITAKVIDSRGRSATKTQSISIYPYSAPYFSSNAVLLRTAVNNSWSSHRVFHAGMATPIPVANGGTGGATAKAALNSLGIFFASTLPSSGTDGQICLVPMS